MQSKAILTKWFSIATECKLANITTYANIGLNAIKSSGSQYYGIKCNICDNNANDSVSSLGMSEIWATVDNVIETP